MARNACRKRRHTETWLNSDLEDLHANPSAMHGLPLREADPESIALSCSIRPGNRFSGGGASDPNSDRMDDATSSTSTEVSPADDVSLDDGGTTSGATTAADATTSDDAVATTTTSTSSGDNLSPGDDDAATATAAAGDDGPLSNDGAVPGGGGGALERGVWAPGAPGRDRLGGAHRAAAHGRGGHRGARLGRGGR